MSEEAQREQTRNGINQYMHANAPRPEDFEAPSYMPAGDASTYRAVFFDLDGTLLPMELSDFLGTYVQSLGTFIVERGADYDLFEKAFNAGVDAMVANEGPNTNDNVFWEAFWAILPYEGIDWRAQTLEYYEKEFVKIGEDVEPDPAAAHIVKTLAEKGYPLVLATMPMFPLTAVICRVKWAGVDPDVFARITSYETSTAVKPRTRYYKELLEACGLEGRDVLMIGNNTVEDLSFAKLGAEVYIATDHLLNPAKLDMATVPHGSLAEIADWAESLGPCENPAEL